MKTGFSIILLISLILSGCQAIELPLPTPEPKCGQSTCIKQAFAYISQEDSKYVWIELELTLLDGKPIFGQSAKFPSNLMMAIYKADGNVYLIGADLPVNAKACYTGNDIPWSNGKLASMCSFAFPLSQMVERPKVGDKLKVDVATYNFNQILSIESRK